MCDIHKGDRMAKRCLKIIVTGKVQGVSFRKFVKKEADGFSVQGTVQNNNNGSIVIHACGESEALDKFIDQLYKGPKSKITEIKIETVPTTKDFRNVFRIIGD